MPIFKWLENRKQAKLAAEQKEIKERRQREEDNQAERALSNKRADEERALKKTVEEQELKNQREVFQITHDELLDDIIERQEDYCLRRARGYTTAHDGAILKQMHDEKKRRALNKASLRIQMSVASTQELIKILQEQTDITRVDAVHRMLAARVEAADRQLLNSFIEKETGYQPEEIPNGNANQSAAVTESAAGQEDSGSNSGIGICIPKYWPGSEPVKPT